MSFFKDTLGRYDRRLWPLFFGRVISSLGHGVSFPFLAIYFTSQLGVSAWMVGAVISTAAVMGGISKFIGGSLSDRFGRKIVMLVALAGRGGTTVAIGLLALQDKPDWIPIALLFIFGGGFSRLFEPSSHAMVADISDESTRTAGYGLLRVGTNLGWAIGVMSGGLIGKSSYAAMFLTTSIVIGVSFLVILALVRETAPAMHKTKEERTKGDGVFRQQGFMLLCGAGILIHVVMAQLVMPLSIHGKSNIGLGEDQIGALFFINGMMVVLLQFPLSRWVETKMRLTTGLILGCLFFAAGYGALGWMGAFWTMAACVAVFTIGEILVAPGTVAMAANLAPEDRRGHFLGTFGFATMGGRFAGPLLGGILLDVFSDRPWIHWSVIAALSCAAAAGFFVLRFRVPPKADLG